MKALIVLVSSNNINISHAGLQKIIDIIIVNNSVIVPILILQTAYSLLNIIAVSSIPMAPGYLTDRFALNNRVHVCHTCNCTYIPFQLLISIQVALFHILLKT